MPGYARREIVREGEVGVYHCVARCVRRAFLCGHDPVSGKDYEHHKSWLQRRLEELAGIFNGRFQTPINLLPSTARLIPTA